MASSDSFRSTTVQLPQAVRQSTRLPSAFPAIPQAVYTGEPAARRVAAEAWNEDVKRWWKSARFAIEQDYADLSSGTNTAIRNGDANATAIRAEVTARTNGDTTILSQVETMFLTSSGNQVFLQTEEPASPPARARDLWIDTDDGFHLWCFDGEAWVDARDAAVNGALAAISTEQQTRISADSALAQQITALSARVTDAETGLTGVSNALDLVETDVTAHGDSITAHGTRLTTLESTVTAQGNTISGHTTSITQITTDVTAHGQSITAQGNKITALESSVNTPTTGLLARVLTIETTYATDTEVEAKKSEAISAAATYTNGQVLTRNKTFRQGTQPTATANGDIWYNTEDGNKPYVWNGSVWVATDDTRIGSLVTSVATITTDYATKVYADSSAEAKKNEAISSSQTYTNGQVLTRAKTFIQASAPTATAVGDIWYNSGDNNRASRWSGTAWVAVDDARIATLSSSVSTITSTYATKVYADGVAETKKTEAVSAAATYTNGQILTRAKTFRQNTQPAATATGDLWYNTGDNNKVTRWDGTSWVATDDSRIASLASSVATITTDYATKTYADGTAEAKKTEAITAAQTYTNTTVGTETANRTAAITAEASARATADGYLSGKYTIRVDAGGRVAGMNITSSSGAGTDSSEISFNADVFKVFNGSSNEAPFEVVNGLTRVKCLVSGKVSTFSQRFHQDDADKTMPNVAAVSASVGNISYASITTHPTWYWATSDSCIMKGWTRGASGYDGARFGNSSQHFTVNAIGNGNGGSSYLIYGLGYRTRTDGVNWGAWNSVGHDLYMTGSSGNVNVFATVDLSGLTGATEVQFGLRVAKPSGATGCSVSGCWLYAHAYN